MTLFTIALPAIKTLVGRLGTPEIDGLPGVLRPDGAGAVIVCNHVGWADSIWLGYALYPRQLRFISKQELSRTPVARWVLEQSGCISINRADPAPQAIKTAVDLLRQGEVILVFPSGTRTQENAVYKRGAASLALHAQVPIVPAFYSGPKHIRVVDLMDRPRVRISFGPIIATAGLSTDKPVAEALTCELQTAIDRLGAGPDVLRSAA